MRGLFIFNLKQRWRLVLRKIVESIIDTNRGVIKHLISMPRVLLSFFIVKLRPILSCRIWQEERCGRRVTFLGSFKRENSSKWVGNIFFWRSSREKYFDSCNLNNFFDSITYLEKIESILLERRKREETIIHNFLILNYTNCSTLREEKEQITLFKNVFMQKWSFFKILRSEKCYDNKVEWILYPTLLWESD